MNFVAKKRNLLDFVISKDINNLNLITSHNKTLLHLACISNEINAVKYFLEKGANPSILSKEGISPLCEMFRAGNLQICSILVGNSKKLVVSEGFKKQIYGYLHAKEQRSCSELIKIH